MCRQRATFQEGKAPSWKAVNVRVLIKATIIATPFLEAALASRKVVRYLCRLQRKAQSLALPELHSICELKCVIHVREGDILAIQLR